MLREDVGELFVLWVEAQVPPDTDIHYCLLLSRENPTDAS